MNGDKKKGATLDSLAVMVQHGFEDIDEKFKGVDRRFDEMNERFDQLEKIILHDHNDRIGRLEDQVKELQADFRNLLSGKR